MNFPQTSAPSRPGMNWKLTLLAGLTAALLAAPMAAQAPGCPSGPSPTRAARMRYADMPSRAFPFGSFIQPYALWFTTPDSLAFDGSGRARPDADWRRLRAINLGFLGPLDPQYSESVYGIAMLHGAELALARANARGGFHGKPFALKIHRDSPLWGASAIELVRMDYRQHVWAMLGSVDGASTHIALRATLKLWVPIVDTATTDPTVTETRIPWLLHDFPDDRQQGYALADYIFNQLHLKHVAILRANNRYGRLGYTVFFNTARRWGKQPVMVLKFEPYATGFTRSLRELQQLGMDGLVLWCNARQAGLIVRQMRALGMRQPVFGPSRLTYPALIQTAGVAANGVVTVAAINPDRRDPKWLAFRRRYRARYHADPDAYAAYAYDGMNLLIAAVRQAGLNRTRIMDALHAYAMRSYAGVSGTAFFDYTLNNIAPVTMARVEHGHFVYWPERRSDWSRRGWPGCTAAAGR